MADTGSGETRNMISGGTHGLVLQGRDFNNVTINVAPAAAAPVALAQLPPLLTGFTGREAELAEITALLEPAVAAGAVVVSAVAGLAGVGKTALAIQAAHAARQAGWFPGGILFVDLHGYDDAPVQPGQALDALLRAVGVAAEYIPPTTEQRIALYRSSLAQISDPVLIIADNASSEAQVQPLLPGLGPHRVVVTSRHTLAGLGARLLDVTVLDAGTAVALLDTALRVARPGDDRIGADPVGAVELAGICGGLPLALQITAALLKADPSRTVSDLADELEDEVERLKALRYDDGGGTSAPSVAAAFELSYRRLDKRTARVFRLMPVNPGPDASTAAVAALADIPIRAARTEIGRLVRAHLVEAAVGAAGRWRMHDLLRLYAGQLSHAYADADRREAARDRLLDYYLDTANAADAHLRALPGTPVPADFTDHDGALAWLDAERPSLIAAVTMAASTGRDRIAMRLPLNLAQYLSWRRRLTEWLRVTGTSRLAARRLGDRGHEAEALNNIGLVLQNSSASRETAITMHQDAAAIFREIGDRNGEGTTLNNLGLALRGKGRVEEAMAAHWNAAAIFRETVDRHGEGAALDGLSLALAAAGRFDEAIAAHRDAAAIFRETGDRHGEGMALDNLGLALWAAGQVEGAIAAQRDATAIFRETGDRHREGMALYMLGGALRKTGRFEEAIAADQDAAAIFRETGERHLEGAALNKLSLALMEAGRFKEATAPFLESTTIEFEDLMGGYQNAVVLFRETRDRHGEGMALNELGFALMEADRFEEAIAAHQDAVAIFRETGDQDRESIALRYLESAQTRATNLKTGHAAPKGPRQLSSRAASTISRGLNRPGSVHTRCGHRSWACLALSPKLDVHAKGWCSDCLGSRVLSAA